MSKSFELRILGTGSATPTLKRNPSAQLLNVRDHYYLIDCAEGSQISLRKYKVRFQRIEHVFISHLHGDHYLGLAGLLSTFSLLGRSKELHIYSPPGLKEVIDLHFSVSQSQSNFPIHFHEIPAVKNNLLLENDKLRVYSYPLQHRIPTFAFLFKEKIKARHINGPLAKEYKVPYYLFEQLKRGEDAINKENGEVYSYKKFTFDADPSYSYAYCSDTLYMPELSDWLQDVDLLYHETTFMQKDEDLAKKTFHSTCLQAAMIAKNAHAKKLLMGHYSSRYEDEGAMLAECKLEFENSHFSRDGDFFKLP